MFRFALQVLFLLVPTVNAYSVLTHEAIIDAAWEDSLRPVLLQRFPSATEEDLRKAHAYAYGGAIIQDLGYYPLSSRFFSDLVHYVRSGDFINNLVTESRDLNEYAFALGSVAHHAADNYGHPIAINRSVPILYPKLARRFGNSVTYEDDPASHLKVEFGFDVLQVANRRYAPEAYRDFIGFEVAPRLLDRAFQKTYGLELEDVFARVGLAVGSYRYMVGTVIPHMTKVAWQLKKKELTRSAPELRQEQFVFAFTRAEYEELWGREYERPGICARIVAALFRLLPKVGPFHALAFRPPTPETEKLFLASFKQTLDVYRASLERIGNAASVPLANDNFDTGQPCRHGDYRLADEAYDSLLEKLANKKFAGVDPDLRANIAAFYKGRPPKDEKVASAFARFTAFATMANSQ
jgi:hypothetical protein